MVPMHLVVSTESHYDMLIDEGNDPLRDSRMLRAYMERWDGPAFYRSLCLGSKKTVLEIGVGTGRIAKRVLDMGCKHLTGLDISSKTIQRAKENLAGYCNVELLLAGIEGFRRDEHFDVAYSVLTFMHIENKELVLSNIIDSLRPRGDIVLSISRLQDEWLDCGRKVRLYPKDPEYYLACLEKLGCRSIQTCDLFDTLVLPNGNRSPEYGEKVATIVKATKR